LPIAIAREWHRSGMPAAQLCQRSRLNRTFQVKMQFRLGQRSNELARTVLNCAALVRERSESVDLVCVHPCKSLVISIPSSRLGAELAVFAAVAEIDPKTNNKPNHKRNPVHNRKPAH